MLRCRKVRAWIDLAVDGELSVERSLVVDEHVGGCERCARYRAVARGLEEALQRLPEPPREGLELERAVAAVHAVLASEAQDPARGGRRLALGVALAAGVLGLVGLGLFLGRRAGAPEAPSARTAAARPGPAEPSTPIGARARLRGALTVREDELLASYDAAARTLVRERRWPALRIVEDLLGDEDARVARAAAAVLGARGDRISAVALRRALAREAVATSALDALTALVRSGVEDVTPLAEALRDERLAEPALAALVSVGGRASAEVIEAAIERGARGSGSPLRPGTGVGRERLLDALARCGAPALESLLRLAARSRGAGDARDAVLARLELVAGAGEALERHVRRSPRAHPTSLLLDAAARLQPDGLLPWIEELCIEREHRDAALSVLARWEGVGALEAMLRLRSGGRLPESTLRGPGTELVARDPGRAADLARDRVRAGAHAGTRALLDFLLACETTETVPALVVLASAEGVAEEDRQWAALGAGELGRPDDAELLAEALARIDPARERLVAAFLISIHDLAGAPGTTSALRALGRPTTHTGPLLDALRRASERRGAVHLHRVARELAALTPHIASSTHRSS